MMPSSAELLEFSQMDRGDRRLRSFKDVTKHIGRKGERSVVKESQDYSVLQPQKVTDLNYFVISVPRNISYDEKLQRLSLLADKVTDVEGSDVICMVMWVPSALR
jgi:hypothetical protein